MHVSSGYGIIPARGMVDVALIETDDGIEIKLSVHGSVVSTAVTLIPELAVELGHALDHGQRAVGLELAAG